MESEGWKEEGGELRRGLAVLGNGKVEEHTSSEALTRSTQSSKMRVGELVAHSSVPVESGCKYLSEDTHRRLHAGTHKARRQQGSYDHRGVSLDPPTPRASRYLPSSQNHQQRSSLRRSSSHYPPKPSQLPFA